MSQLWDDHFYVDAFANNDDGDNDGMEPMIMMTVTMIHDDKVLMTMMAMET